MLACFRQGYVVLPCTEQLRAHDLRLRLDVAQPRLVVADERNRATLREAGWSGETLWVPFEDAPATEVAPADLDPDDPCMVIFTSGTSGEPKAAVHGQRYLPGQRLQAEHWLAPQPGQLVWCTAAAGWSKSARNAFIAPWLRGAAALLHDARFDPHERLDIIERERVDVLCMAPTEYRVIAKRADTAPAPVAARRGGGRRGAQPRGPARLARGDRAVGARRLRADGDRGADRRRGRRDAAARLDGPAAAGRRPAHRRRRAGPARPGDRSDVLRALPRRRRRTSGPWRTGDRVHADEDGYLYFEGRTDDVIISAGYRIGPFEVESALVAHAAVAEAAVVAAPDDERGAVVRAVVVLRDGYAASDALVRELQDHVKSQTAPYKYPRIVDFIDELPKTASGKVRRAALRG